MNCISFKIFISQVFFTTLLIGTYASIAYGGFLGGSSYSQATHSAPAYASSLQVTGTVAESHSQEASNALVNEPAPAHPEIRKQILVNFSQTSFRFSFAKLFGFSHAWHVYFDLGIMYTYTMFFMIQMFV